MKLGLNLINQGPLPICILEVHIRNKEGDARLCGGAEYYRVGPIYLSYNPALYYTYIHTINRLLHTSTRHLKLGVVQLNNYSYTES